MIPLALLPSRTLRLALDIHRDDFLLKFCDAVTYLAPIQFSVRLAAAPSADAATLPPLWPRKLRRLAQAGCHIPKARNLHLGLSGTRAGIAMKNFEDDHSAVHYLAADLLFKIARL